MGKAHEDCCTNQSLWRWKEPHRLFQFTTAAASLPPSIQTKSKSSSSSSSHRHARHMTGVTHFPQNHFSTYISVITVNYSIISRNSPPWLYSCLGLWESPGNVRNKLKEERGQWTRLGCQLKRALICPCKCQSLGTTQCLQKVIVGGCAHCTFSNVLREKIVVVVITLQSMFFLLPRYTSRVWQHGFACLCISAAYECLHIQYKCLHWQYKRYKCLLIVPTRLVWCCFFKLSDKTASYPPGNL